MPVEVKIAPFGTDEKGEPNPPHESQLRVFDWADLVRDGMAPAEGIPVLYVQGGWRSGKTTAVLGVILEIMEEHPGIRVLIGRKDFNDLRLSTMESWRDVRPRELVANEDKQEHRETWINGSQVFFRELKDLEGLGGQEFGLILVSEPYELDEQVYYRLKGRISQARMPHMLLMEGNPPNEGHWLHKLVVGDDRTIPDKDITFLEMPTDENWENLPLAYRRSIESAPAAWQKKYRLGKWGFTPAGQPVYDIFSEELHVRYTQLIPDRPVIRSWDSGARHPACLWAQTTARGHLFVQHEWLGMNTGLGVFSDGCIMRTNENYGKRVTIDVGDPAMFARSPQTGRTDAQVLAGKGVFLRGRQSTYQERKALIDSRLSLLIDGKPAVQIHPRCRTLIDALLGGYHYPAARDGQAFSKRLQDPHKDGFFEHLANCFEYLIINMYGTSSNAAQRVINRHRSRMRRAGLTQGAVVY